MNLFFIFDEHSDKCEADKVWNQVDIIMDALRHPDKPRPEGEWIGGEVARQWVSIESLTSSQYFETSSNNHHRFWSRILKISTPTFQSRFLKTWEEYLHGTAQQAEDRSRAHIRDIASYLEVRRRTIGAKPSFNILEMDMDLPDEVKYNPTILELDCLAIDLTIIANVSSWSFSLHMVGRISL